MLNRPGGYSCVMVCVCVALMALVATTAAAEEVQLAGIRLGQHAIHLLDVYGQPDAVVIGGTGGTTGVVAAGPAGGGGGVGAAASGAMGPGMGGPGMMGAGGPGGGPMPGMPGGAGMPGMGGGPMGGGAGMMGGGGGPGMMGGGGPGMMGGGGPGMMGGGGPGMMGGGPMGGGPGMAGGAGMPGMGGGMMGGGPMGGGAGMMGGGGGPGMMGGGGPGMMGGGMMGGAAGGGAVSAAQFPQWALPVAIGNMQSDEQMWIYQRGPVVISFVLDRDAYVNSIAIAADKCDYARTALWRPNKYIKLGDSFKHVMYRYGVPDQLLSFDGSVAGTASAGGGIVQVSVSSTTGSGTLVAARDMVMRYTERNNIEFTLHNMKVTRIHIWQR